MARQISRQGKMLKMQGERAAVAFRRPPQLSGSGLECPPPNRLNLYTQTSPGPVP
jgi:hypothetical protein